MDSRITTILCLSFGGLFGLGCGTAPVGDGGQTGSGSEGDGDGDTSETGDGDGDGDGDQLPPCADPPAGGGVAGPPSLVSAEIVGDRLLQLTFSEPMAPVDGFDPSAFRISVARYDDYYKRTTYWDPMLVICSNTDGCFGDYTDVVELGCVDGDPSSLLLRVDILRDDILCPLLGQQAQYGYVSSLLPHFDAAIAPLTDADGEALASFGAAWVSYEQYAMLVAGELPDYPSPLPIPCG